jgi:hypothetical protein
LRVNCDMLVIFGHYFSLPRARVERCMYEVDTICYLYIWCYNMLLIYLYVM